LLPNYVIFRKHKTKEEGLMIVYGKSC